MEVPRGPQVRGHVDLLIPEDGPISDLETIKYDVRFILSELKESNHGFDFNLVRDESMMYAIVTKHGICICEIIVNTHIHMTPMNVSIYRWNLTMGIEHSLFYRRRIRDEVIQCYNVAKV